MATKPKPAPTTPEPEAKPAKAKPAPRAKPAKPAKPKPKTKTNRTPPATDRRASFIAAHAAVAKLSADLVLSDRWAGKALRLCLRASGINDRKASISGMAPLMSIPADGAYDAYESLVA